MGESNSGKIDSRRIDIWNIKVNLLDREQIVELINDRLAEGCRGLYFTPVDANVIMLAQTDEKLRSAIMASEITNVDSYLPAKYLKKAGYVIKGRVPTPEIMEALLERASQLGQRVYFLGAKDSTLELLHSVVKTKFPGVDVVGMHNGYFSDSENPRIADMISAVSPDLVFVGMPSPKKETFVMSSKDTIDAGLLYCVGGAFDAMAGVLPRPPKWLMFGPMEGVLRIMRNPRVYWKRAFMCFKFMRFAKKWNKLHLCR